MAEQQGLDPETPPGLHLVSAFLAMEPSDSLISLARVCGGGSVTESVQRFIWDHCINKADRKGHASHLKNFLKKLIVEVESNHGDVLDELYEQYANYMVSLKDDSLVKGNARVHKCISFLFPDGCFELPTCHKSRKLLVPLQCSLNMLDGDTGCSIWPSSLFLSEFILSFPDMFCGKSCFEVGSGVGLAGICLAHVKASKNRKICHTFTEVILSDGDLSTLANMKLNLEVNQLSTKTDVPERATEDPNMVKCIHLPWESASLSELYDLMPDIILGADVIYDPSCLPHLVRVLTVLLNKVKPYSRMQRESSCNSVLDSKYIYGKFNSANQGNILHSYNVDESASNNDSNGHLLDDCRDKAIYNCVSNGRSRECPVAYIASVIRNIDTFNYFLALADQANLAITDLTETLRPFNFLPYLQSYDRSSIRLFTVFYK